MSQSSDVIEPGRPPCIVVADDDLVQLRLMTAILERSGFEVAAVNDGAKALHLVLQRRPVALIVDALMPRLNGFDTIERIRQEPDFDTLPTIVVSGLGDLDSRVRALSIGADDFLIKPVHADELIARLRAHLRQAAAWSAHAPDDPDDGSIATWLDEVTSRRSFEVHFQPIVDITSGRTTAQEALVRFHDGTCPSTVFKSNAPDRRITELELCIVEEAIQAGSCLSDDELIHVNVSPAAARSPRLPALIASARRPIVLEITEHELFGPDDAARLRESLPPSTRLAADDVGAGFSGLTQLVQVRPDIVKVDREIISDIHDDPVRQVIVAGLVRFAATTGARLIAEGVEQRAEAAMLIDLGVSLGQGFYFGRPVPVASARTPDRAHRRLAAVRRLTRPA